MTTRMLQRRGDAAEWTAQNPILGDGEIGVERDTGEVKIGNGVTHWNDLAYAFPSAAALAAKADLVGGKVPSGQLPAITTGEHVTVANQAAMLALTAAQVQPGDIAIRTDQSGHRYLLADPDPSVLGNWIALETPDGVTSVQGYTGAVVLSKADIALGNVDNTSDINKPVSTAQQTALNNKQPLAAQLTSISGLALAGQAGKVLTVKADASGYELDTPAAGGGGSSATGDEARLIQIMTPGRACSGLRGSGGTMAGGVAVSALTVPAGRLYVVKTILISGPDGGSGNLTPQPVEIWKQGNTYDYVKDLPVGPNGTFAFDTAIVLTAAEVLRIQATGAHGGIDYVLSYADLASTEKATRFADSVVSTVAAGFVTLYTAATGVPVVITQIIMTNELATPQRISLLASAGHASVWREPVPPNGVITLDSPIYLSAGETLRMAVYDTDNGVAVSAFGYPAQT